MEHAEGAPGKDMMPLLKILMEMSPLSVLLLRRGKLTPTVVMEVGTECQATALTALTQGLSLHHAILLPLAARRKEPQRRTQVMKMNGNWLAQSNDQDEAMEQVREASTKCGNEVVGEADLTTITDKGRSKRFKL